MTTETNVIDCKTIDTPTLSKMLMVGKKSAVRFGDEAGARVKIGRRTLWNVEKIQKHIDSISK